MTEEEVGLLVIGTFFWWIFIWEVLFIALHVIIAKRFKRNSLAWGIAGIFFSLFSLILLIALGEKKNE